MPFIFDFDDEFRKMRPKFDKLFEKFGRFFSEFKEPLADIEETPKEVIVKIDIPGVSKEDINLEITDDSLKIKAEKKKEKEEKKRNFYRAERSYRGFYREMSLPCIVDSKNAKATYKDGVLKVVLKKKQKKRAREIIVK